MLTQICFDTVKDFKIHSHIFQNPAEITISITDENHHFNISNFKYFDIQISNPQKVFGFCAPRVRTDSFVPKNIFGDRKVGPSVVFDFEIKSAKKLKIINEAEYGFNIMDNTPEYMSGKRAGFVQEFITIHDISKPDHIGKSPDMVDITRMQVYPIYGRFFQIKLANIDDPFEINSIDNSPLGLEQKDSKTIAGVINSMNKQTFLVYMSYQRKIMVTINPQYFERII